MFEIIKDRMEFALVKRTEKHGNDKVAAYDAKFVGDFPNAVLIKLDERLRGVFYGPSKQGDIEADYFPELLFPLMGAVSWGLKLARMELRLHDIDDQENDLLLTGKELDKIEFSMKPGGTVTMSFRVILGQLEEDDLIKLLRVDNQEIQISLTQAPIEEKKDNYEQAELITQEPMSEGRKKAESAFSNPVGAQTPEEVVMAEPDFSDPPNPSDE